MAAVPTQTITAVTTIFTPPADCKTSWTYEAESFNSVSGGLLIQNLTPGSFATSCFPQGFVGYGRVASVQQVFSPYVCPNGYATPGQFNADGTTTGICCQSGFRYASTYSSINYFGSKSFLFMGCISTYSGVTSVPARADGSHLTSTVVTGPLTLWGQPITVAYQQKDLSITALFSSSTSSSSSSTPSSTATNTGAASSSSATDSPTLLSSDSGLSTGAKAGIGAGIAVLVLLLIALGIFIWKKRSSRHRTITTQDTKEPYRPQKSDTVAAWGPNEIEGQSYWPRPELEGDSYRSKSNYTAHQGARDPSELE